MLKINKSELEAQQNKMYCMLAYGLKNSDMKTVQHVNQPNEQEQGNKIVAVLQGCFAK